MIIFICILLLCVLIVLLISGYSKNEKQLTNKASEKKALFTGRYKHCIGLPAPQDFLWLYQFEDHLLFEFKGAEYSIPYDRVRNISYMTETEITKYYTSSVGGAVAGGILLGPIGAFIGGRTKEKKNVDSSTYMIITYIDKNNDLSSINLEDVVPSLSNQKLFKEFFTKHSDNSDPIKVEL